MIEFQPPMSNGLRVLAAFCGVGGCTRGYQRAGFHVTGVDIAPQPRYCGNEFHRGDAVEYIREHGHEYDLIHAGPPCQRYTPLNAYNHKVYPDLIGPTRAAFEKAGLPYVIENVEAAAPELNAPTLLCGPMFGLSVYRHRLFETNWPLVAPAHPKHVELCTRNGYLPTPEKPFMSIHGGRHSRAWQNAACDAITRSASFELRAEASVELSEAVAKAPAPAAPQGLRAEVLRRDGWQCCSCGWSPGDLVPSAPTGRPLYRGLEIDHIHPRSLGGPDSLDNFQVLCTTCNTRKGAKI